MVLATAPVTALALHTDAVVLLSPVDTPDHRATVDIPGLRVLVDTPSLRVPVDIPSLRGYAGNSYGGHVYPAGTYDLYGGSRRRGHGGSRSQPGCIVQ